MMAPTEFIQINGFKIAVDAFDICIIEECEDNNKPAVKVTYAITYKETATFMTHELFSDVLEKFAAMRHVVQNPPEEGDEWRQ